MSRYLEGRKLTPAQFKADIQADDEDAVRKFLYGYLGPTMFSELKAAHDEGGDIYAALYELDDDELVRLLCALGERAHVVLGNGSIPDETGVPAAEERKRDQNKKARRLLVQAGVDVGKKDRFISPGALAHNKFFVRTSKNGDLLTAWTGSTNWTTTGLCTQLNNGLLIRDPGIATEYMHQWERLRDAASAFPPSLIDANSTEKPFQAPPSRVRRAFTRFDTPPPASTGTIWFTRTRDKVDLDALNAEVMAAKVGILFLMFMPGGNGVLPAVQKAAANPDFYVRGVVSQLPTPSKSKKTKDQDVVHVDVVKDAVTKRLSMKIVEPRGNNNPISKWAVAELTRGQFTASVGRAIVHSKAMVIDPFTEHPVVITGSHNFSDQASTGNDEKFIIIIRDDPPLAEAYAVHIMSAYDHYRYRAAQQENLGLHRTDDWMKDKLDQDSQELRVWNVRS